MYASFPFNTKYTKWHFAFDLVLALLKFLFLNRLRVITTFCLKIILLGNRYSKKNEAMLDKCVL